MFTLQTLIRPNIRDLKPYSSARQEYSGNASTLLDANENPYPLKLDLSQIPVLNRYPDPCQTALRQQIAQMKRTRTENIFLGVGSDEVLDLLIRIFCRPGVDSILICPPTYGMYEVSAVSNDIAVKKIFLRPDFQLDTEGILSAVEERTKMIFLCSPNNPTGNLLNRSDIMNICKSFSGIVVLDEAYIDFAFSGASLITELENLPNLVILQTLSKAWGLAGIRLGMAFASEDIIQVLNKIKAPYSINTLTSFVARQVLEQDQEAKQSIRILKKERERIFSNLKNNSKIQKVYVSDANFLLVRVPDAKSITKKLADQGVVVRYRGNEPLCDDCIRITVGTPQQNEQLLKALNSILS